MSVDVSVHLQRTGLCLCHRQRAELEDLRRQLEENSSLAGRALKEELDKTREEQERRHQVRTGNTAEPRQEPEISLRSVSSTSIHLTVSR